MTTTTMNTMHTETQEVQKQTRRSEEEPVWPKGSIATLFGLTAACIIGAGIVLLGTAELVMAVF